MNFGKRGSEKQFKELTSKSVKRLAGLRVWALRIIFYVAILVIAVVIFAGFGAAKGMIETAPEVDEQSISPLGYATTVYDCNGIEIEKLSTSGSNREEAELSEVPEYLKWAFIDVEDERFYEHNGIDVKGIMRAIYKDILAGNFKEGASTLTQQLLKNNVFESGGWETSTGSLIKRKFQEQYLALELEKKVDKDTILINYLNTINLGGGNYGVKSAAHYYFGKDVSELTLSESAVIAGITKNPSGYNPVRFPEANAERREIVLKKMLDYGHITQEEYDAAMADDVYSRIQAIATEYDGSAYSYFIDALIDQVSADLKERLGYTDTQVYNAIYSGGLIIYSTEDSDMQAIVESEMQNEENFYGEGISWSIDWRWSVKSADGTITNYDQNSLKQWRKDNGYANYTTFDSQEEAAAAVAEFKAAIFQATDTDLGETEIQYIIQPQCAFTVMDQSNGEVKAIVGGRGTKTGSMTLNRATDSARQPGSCFKPLAAYAPAIDSAGYTLGTVIEDSPFNYGMSSADADTNKVSNWWGDTYRGLNTVQTGIQDSMNILAVKTMQNVGAQVSYQYLLDFGFTTLVPGDANLSTALGGVEYGVTPLELCAAYATIANHGVYNKPVFYTQVVDKNGKILLENNDENRQSRTVLKETTADLLTIGLEKVVTSGTGTAAAFGGMDVAGKTGTSQNTRDLLFTGYTPYLTACIWTGYDDNLNIGGNINHTALWSNIMAQIHDVKGYGAAAFSLSGDIVPCSICTKSGKLAVGGLCDCDPEGSKVETYYYANGTQPTETCDVHTKLKICTASGKVATANCPAESVTEVVYRIVPSLSGNISASADGSLTANGSATTGDTSQYFETVERPYAVTEELLKDTCTVHTSTPKKSTDTKTTTTTTTEKANSGGNNNAQNP